MRFFGSSVRLLTVIIAVLMLGAAIAWKPPAKVAIRDAAAAKELGRLLFFDPIFSANGKRSCASCHRPEKAFTDHRITARGLRFATNLPRNTPTLLHVGGQRRFFHDGRAGSLDGVVAAVLTNPQEFGSSYDTLAARLADVPEYRQLFANVFGRTEPISPATINAALAIYVQALTLPSSAYDAARNGVASLSAEARRGAGLFAETAGCARCHPAPAFRDGRLHALPSGDSLKTPTLRNVAATMPYRADGSAATLAEVLTDPFHRRQTARNLSPDEVEALIIFLNTLTDTVRSPLAQPPARLPDSRRWPDRPVGGLY